MPSNIVNDYPIKVKSNDKELSIYSSFPLESVNSGKDIMIGAPPNRLIYLISRHSGPFLRIFLQGIDKLM